MAKRKNISWKKTRRLGIVRVGNTLQIGTHIDTMLFGKQVRDALCKRMKVNGKYPMNQKIVLR